MAASDLVARMSEHVKIIYIIGDCMVDHWIHGKVQECQDGCMKLVEERNLSSDGGAANARISLAEWRNVDARLHGQTYEHWPEKCRFIDQDGMVRFRWDKEYLPPDEVYSMERSRALMLKGADAVLLSDYDKGFLSPEFIRRVVEACKKRKIPCVADCKREPDLYEGCILKCNLDWFERRRGMYHGHPVVTRGPFPPVVMGKMDPDYALPSVKCVNHIGAGDCFAAHLTLALACGLTLQEAATVAHSAGRVYVQYPHSRPPLPQEIAADLATAR